MPSKSPQYVFNSSPAAGETMEISPGIIWLRQTLPFSLNHINVWLLHDQDRFSIVDTGINSKQSKRHWLDALEKHVPKHTPDKIVITHLHPDHVGLAGWFCQKFERPLWMTCKEYLLCRLLCEDTGRPAPKEALDFYQATGIDGNAMEHYKKTFGQFGTAVAKLPQSYHRMQDQDRLTIGAHDWRVLIGNGHSPEHACLFSESQNLLISGDQLLPGISSIVAVWPTEPLGNPLKDWIDSCRRLKTQIPKDVLVLPSHGFPFRGALDRLQGLIDHHEEKLELLLSHCAQPRRVVDVFDILFNSKIDHSNLFMAVGESVAHLNFLLAENKLTKTIDANGVDWYASH